VSYKLSIDPGIQDEDAQDHSGADSLLSGVLEQSTRHSPLPSAHICTLSGFDPAGYPLIEYQGVKLRAEAILSLSADHLGQRCVLSFENGDARKPIIMGLLWQPGQAPTSQKQIEAGQSLKLSCGRSSLELEADGTVRLQGVTVTTQAYGSNRVKGAAVKIN